MSTMQVPAFVIVVALAAWLARADGIGGLPAGPVKDSPVSDSPAVLTAGQSWDDFGASVACAGDVDADGYDDVIVGAPADNDGAAYLYRGSAAGVETTEHWSAMGQSSGEDFGEVVAGAGDVNGDGFADILVADPGLDNGQGDEGQVYLYLGSLAGPSFSPDWIVESDVRHGRMGHSLGSAGDVNGDGYDDVVVGVPVYDVFDDIAETEGWAFVYHGSAGGTSATPDWSFAYQQNGDQMGTSVAGAGDVNGDGYADVIVGAPYHDSDSSNTGRAYVFHGSASGLEASPVWSADGDQAEAFFGQGVASAGDVNGDGYADVIVGAYLYDNIQANQGRAVVYLGSANGLAGTPASVMETDDEDAYFGFSVASAGDLNADGRDEVVVGAYGCDYGYTNNQGKAFVYSGNDSGTDSSPSWIGMREDVFYPRPSEYAFSVASAGDVNGDGVADLVIGVPLYDTEGAALVHLGLGCAPLASDDTTCDGVDDDCDGEMDEDAESAGSCDDGVDCTMDSCQEGVCLNLSDHSVCNDDLYCNGIEICDALVGCQAGTDPCTPPLICDEGTDQCVGCLVDGDCDDGIDCTSDSCNEASGACDHLPVDADCNDGNGCTLDSCDPVQGCQFADDDGSACSVGACNGTCQAGRCQGCSCSSPADCDDGVGCTVEDCQAGMCINLPDDDLCEDDAWCNGIAVCDPVQDCQAGIPQDCDDGLVCTQDSCDEQADACVHDWDAAEFCLIDDSCVPMGQPHPDNPCLACLPDGFADEWSGMPAGTACGQALCQDGLLTPAPTCDGQGRCVQDEPQPCPYGTCEDQHTCGEVPPDGGTDGGTDAGSDEPSADSGCGCAAQGPGGCISLLAFLLPWWLTRRRRFSEVREHPKNP